MAPSSKRPTGFLDLPLEIRQSIYNEMLPQEPYLTVNELDWDTDRESRVEEIGTKGWEEEQEQRAFQAACQACPQINIELRESPPDNIEYDKLGFIDIVIDHYNLENVERSLISLMLRIRELVDTLRRYDKLGGVWIEFRDLIIENGRGDPYWCCDVDDSQSMWRSPLNTLPGTDCPIVTYLLRPLLRLPTCTYAGITLLDYIVHEGELESTEGLPGPFGYEYMEDLFELAEHRLMGGREKDLPVWINDVPLGYLSYPGCQICSIGEGCNT
ncbi:hypothetical protein LTR56_011761 [Elasticomyces elasticus]|nr:hypothetical protein LTR56_011761 [Elasticomyces elasticus]KAK3663295.1 hypothetical protein LTR22_005953 [Elasticomyces elasticus]KAK4929049.1 hypothetical protein LTR49_004246 [Elasticomyces elasticus]KAK5766428.1 hypothetical protein LTS12_003345 [Elasticomyces elasticus]